MFKTLILMSSAVVAAMLMAACAPKSGFGNRNLIPAPNVNADQKSASQAALAGGDAGVITLDGVILKTDSTLDDRISVAQTQGVSQGQTVATQENKTQKNPNSKRGDGYTPAKNNNYINMGCDLTNDSRIVGLTEVKKTVIAGGTIKSVLLNADKVFLCGAVATDENFTTVQANEIYLSNVKISKEGSIADITFTADLLALDGTNTIALKASDSALPISIVAPTLTLSIYETLSGTGKLVITSAGSSYKAQ